MNNPTRAIRNRLKFPAILLIELTSVCNHNCFGCGNVFDHNIKHIDLSYLSQILTEHKNIIFDVRLTGGEPTLHPEFSQIVNLIEDLNIRYSVLSNGNWSSYSSIEDIFRNKKYFSGFLISLHGSNAKDHDEFVQQKGSFNNVTKNIKNITNAGLYVSTNTILNSKTVNFIDQISNLAHDLGANYAVYNRYYGAHELYQISPSQLKHAVEKITIDRLQGKKVRLGNCTPKCFAYCDSDGCPGGNFAATLDPWFNLRPCNHSPLIVGNLLNETLNDIWKGEKLDKWRNLIPDECINCSFNYMCAGGCRAEALLNETKKDPLISSFSYIKEIEYPELNLYKNQKFNTNYLVRDEDFGQLLYFEGEVLLVNHAGINLLEDIKSNSTVNEIIKKYGAESLHLIAELLLRGFINYID